jgi:hypothetical protein
MYKLFGYYNVILLKGIPFLTEVKFVVLLFIFGFYLFVQPMRNKNMVLGPNYSLNFYHKRICLFWKICLLLKKIVFSFP